MNADEAEKMAKQVALDYNWVWREPISVKIKRKWFFWGQMFWEVNSNIECSGMNVWVLIDDESKQVVKRGYLPR